MLISKNKNAGMLSKLFFQTFSTTLHICDWTGKTNKNEQNITFSLIMKLLKIIQEYPEYVS